MSESKQAINQLDFSHSEHYILSIRLNTDGFSFSIYDTKHKKHYFHQTKTDTSLSLTANTKKAFQELDFLTKPYLTKRVIFTGRRYILLPLELFEDEQKEIVFYHSHTKKENEVIRYDIIKECNIVVLYGIDSSTYKYLKQWDKKVSIQSQISLFIQELISGNKLSDKKQMFIDIQKKNIDILSFYRNSLLSINSFSIQSTADVLYYTLYVWKQLAFNQQKDELILLNNKNKAQEIKLEFNRYLKNITIRATTIPIDFKVK